MIKLKKNEKSIDEERPVICKLYIIVNFMFREAANIANIATTELNLWYETCSMNKKLFPMGFDKKMFVQVLLQF